MLPVNGFPWRDRLAAAWLGETIGPHRIAALAVGFTGVVAAAVDHLGAEEVRGGGTDLFGSAILIELDVVKHEAEVSFPCEGFMWCG